MAARAACAALLLLMAACAMPAVSAARRPSAAAASASASPSHADHVARMEEEGESEGEGARNWFSACVAAGASTEQAAAPSHSQSAAAAFGSAAAHLAAAPMSAVPPLRLVAGRDTSCMAWGWFSDDIATTGWGYLYVESSSRQSGELQSYAAGWLEGALTAERIWQHAQNTFESTFGPTMEPPALTAQWIENQVTYNQAQIQAPSSEFWSEMSNLLTQVQGLAEGYNSAQTANPLTPLQFLYLQLAPDLDDIMAAADPALRPDPSRMTLFEVLALEQRRSHCSSIVKVTDEGELFHAHNTWWNYASMLRIFKLSVMPLPSASGVTVHFSSYPGVLNSMDDYYTVVETQLSITETTNEINNPKMYALCESKSVGSWARAMVANRRATSGAEWTQWFAQQNPGAFSMTPFAPQREWHRHWASCSS